MGLGVRGRGKGGSFLLLAGPSVFCFSVSVCPGCLPSAVSLPFSLPLFCGFLFFFSFLGLAGALLTDGRVFCGFCCCAYVFCSRSSELRTDFIGRRVGKRGEKKEGLLFIRAVLLDLYLWCAVLVACVSDFFVFFFL